MFDLGGSGWASYHSPETVARRAYVKVRFGLESQDEDSPIELREVAVAALTGNAFNSPLLRSIPIGRMTAAANRADVIGWIRSALPPANFKVSAQGTAGAGMSAWELPPPEPVRYRPPSRGIKDPGGRRKPDAFYADVARVFLATASVSNRPAQELAEANNVPPTTVHRWLKEAKARGLLRLPGAAPDTLTMEAT